MSSQVDVYIPHWMYLTDGEQEFIRRELGLALQERNKTLVLHGARTKEMREQDMFVCCSHAQDYENTWYVAPDLRGSARCVECGEKAYKYVLL